MNPSDPPQVHRQASGGSRKGSLRIRNNQAANGAKGIRGPVSGIVADVRVLSGSLAEIKLCTSLGMVKGGGEKLGLRGFRGVIS
jgi:hypothetical protein